MPARRIAWLNSFFNEGCGITRAPFDDKIPLEILNEVAFGEAGGARRDQLRRGAVHRLVHPGRRVPGRAARLGLCVATPWMFAPELAEGRVKQVMEDWTLPSVDLWAVFPTGPRASAKARAFAAFVEEQLGANAI